jgi:hypothetical protein
MDRRGGDGVAGRDAPGLGATAGRRMSAQRLEQGSSQWLLTSEFNMLPRRS